ncbi:MAG: DUF4190 domain-containing protein [Tepidisphaeraceae bacterium]
MTQIPNYQTPQSPQSLPTGMSVASMVLGIVSLVLFCLWYISLPCGIIGLALGLVARGKVLRGEAGGGSMAKTGVICSIIALGLAVLIMILAIVGISILGSKAAHMQIPPPQSNP